MPYVGPQAEYKGLIAAGLTPIQAAEFDAISGRESNWNTSAQSGYRPQTGDYFSTGLFQFNLGANYGPQGNIGLSGPGDIWGSRLQNVLGANPYNALMNDPNADYKAAAWALSQDGFSPWKPGGSSSPLQNVPQSALQAAVDASGGQVTMAQLLAAGNNPTSNPVGTVAGLNQQANQPAIDQLNQQNYLSAAQMAAQQALSTSDINYAQQEYQLQSALLGLSNDQLALQRGALGRQMALDPKMYMLQQAGLQDQAKLLHEQGWDNIRSGVSQEAASGNLFTKGGQAQRQLTTDQFLSQERALSYTKEQERLQYQEQLQSLGDQFKNLDITAKRYGISAKELSDRLQNQLQNISTSFQMNDLQLLGGMLSNNAQIAGLQTYVPPVTPYPYQNSGIPGPQPGNPYYGAPQG